MASLISEEISIEVENLHTKHIHSFLCLDLCLLGFVECCLSCKDCGLRRLITLCPLELFGLVMSGLVDSDCLLGSIVSFPLLKLILLGRLG